MRNVGLPRPFSTWLSMPALIPALLASASREKRSARKARIRSPIFAASFTGPPAASKSPWLRCSGIEPRSACGGRGQFRWGSQRAICRPLLLRQWVQHQFLFGNELHQSPIRGTQTHWTQSNHTARHDDDENAPAQDTGGNALRHGPSERVCEVPRTRCPRERRREAAVSAEID